MCKTKLDPDLVDISQYNKFGLEFFWVLERQLSMPNLVEEMPPITTTFGANGSRQQDMDGKFCKLLQFVLVLRPEDHTIQHLNQHSSLLHGSILVHVSGSCRYIWSHSGPILPEGDSPSSSWMHTSEGGRWDNTWGICGWRGFPSQQQEKVDWQ